MTIFCFIFNLRQNLRFMVAGRPILWGKKTFHDPVNQEGYLIPIKGW
jgi:hypothetical protein